MEILLNRNWDERRSSIMIKIANVGDKYNFLLQLGFRPDIAATDCAVWRNGRKQLITRANPIMTINIPATELSQTVEGLRGHGATLDSDNLSFLNKVRWKQLVAADGVDQDDLDELAATPALRRMSLLKQFYVKYFG